MTIPLIIKHSLKGGVRIGYDSIIKNYNFIGRIVPPLGLKDIEFERFDIDDMPGTNSITIA